MIQIDDYRRFVAIGREAARRLGGPEGLVSRRGDIVHHLVLTGPLHDVAHLRVVPAGAAATLRSSVG